MSPLQKYQGEQEKFCVRLPKRQASIPLSTFSPHPLRGLNGLILPKSNKRSCPATATTNSGTLAAFLPIPIGFDCCLEGLQITRSTLPQERSSDHPPLVRQDPDIAAL